MRGIFHRTLDWWDKNFSGASRPRWRELNSVWAMLKLQNNSCSFPQLGSVTFVSWAWQTFCWDVLGQQYYIKNGVCLLCKDEMMGPWTLVMNALVMKCTKSTSPLVFWKTFNPSSLPLKSLQIDASKICKNLTGLNRFCHFCKLV